MKNISFPSYCKHHIIPMKGNIDYLSLENFFQIILSIIRIGVF
ncbi:GTP cyclohydrolase I [Neoehrlichia mikurensis]|nr:GTP cyclohydrolase I [Neoehrlichia mikurensis]QXK93261.1 GTP cyclohydrolase I [Neoehrlichia mikurensis]QXK94107.1 GTP cyclohydrolase I [Neoehrlichia mikurensis]